MANDISDGCPICDVVNGYRLKVRVNVKRAIIALTIDNINPNLIREINYAKLR